MSDLQVDGLSLEQQELWRRVNELWAMSLERSADRIRSALHPRYAGWDMNSPVPHGREEAIQSVLGDSPEVRAYQLRPLGIEVYDHVAGIVHYSYSATVAPQGANAFAVTGKWTEIYLKQGGQWIMIGVSGRPDSPAGGSGTQVLGLDELGRAMISREQAAEIAEAYAVANRLGFGVLEVRLPEEIEGRMPFVYSVALDNCWIAYIEPPGPPAVGPSTIVVINRENGQILYGGSAYDEGQLVVERFVQAHESLACRSTQASGAAAHPMTGTVVLKALAVWAVILLLAIINGAVREAILLPGLGAPAGLVLSGALLCAMILAAAYLTLPWIGSRHVPHLWGIGFGWLALTIAFEFSFGLWQGKSWSTLVEAYTFRDGNLWPVVLVVVALAPNAAARLRGWA